MSQKLFILLPDQIGIVQYHENAQKLQKAYPNQKIALYNCKETVDNVRSTMFLLHKEDALGEDVKIGYLGPQCSFYPDSVKFDTTPTIQELLNFSEFSSEYSINEDLDLVNLSELTEEQIATDGWKLVTPDTLFQESTRWWFQEQP